MPVREWRKKQMNLKKSFLFSAYLTAMLVAALCLPAYATDIKMERAEEIAFEQGISAFEEGDFSGALTLFTEVLDAAPNDAAALHYRGVTLLKLNQPEEAVKDLEKSSSLDPSAQDVNLDLGAAYQGANRIDDAEKAYRTEIANHPDNAQAHFSLGYVLFTKKKFDECISEFRKSRELDAQLAPAAKFYEASALYQSGKSKEAETMFSDIVSAGAPPEIDKASRQYLDAIRGKKTTRKNWGLMGAVLYQYDTNVVAANEDAEFPMVINDEEISDKEDSRAVITLSGFYRIPKIDPWIVEARYAFYQSFHSELDSFNLQNHAPGVMLGRAQKLFGRDTLIALDYKFSEALMGTDNEWYSMNHYVTPALKIIWSKKFATSVGYTYNAEDFHIAEPNRDNVAHTGFARIDWAFLPDKMSLSAAAGMDFEDSDNPAYDIRRPWLKLALGAKLPLEIFTKLSFSYENEDHFNDDIQNRVDNSYSVDLLVLRKIWGPIEGTVGVNYKSNDSNVDSLTYDRTVAGGGIIVRY